VGIYEALMTGVLAAAGVKPALSLPVTVMFRVLSTLIQVPPGYILYHQTLKRMEEEPAPGSTGGLNEFSDPPASFGDSDDTAKLGKRGEKHGEKQ
jgi:hypothetical protein